MQATLLVEAQATKAAICEALRALIRQMQARHQAPGAERDVLLLSSLMHGLQAEAPRITERLGKPAQTPVVQTFGEVLPLALYRP